MATSASFIRRAAKRLLNGRPHLAGQPLPETHPELLSEGELAPGLLATEFAQRRQMLAEALPPQCLALLPSAPTMYTSPGGRIPYSYRQDADFLYFTGLTQQGVALVESAASSSRGRYSLFLPQSTPSEAVWDGHRISCEAAVDSFGADEAWPIGELPHRLLPLLANAPLVFYDAARHVGNPLIRHSTGNPSPGSTELHIAASQGRLKGLQSLTHLLRWVKSPAELQCMRQAATTSAHAIEQCMRACRPGLREYQLQSLFEYKCRWRGAQRNAYPPVVACGPDATTIHYARNDKVLQDGQLLLMDAGCELHGYSSDITRTWPVSGKFTSAQRDVYHAVLEVHRRCVEACRAGKTMKSIHQLAVRLLSQALKDLGLYPSLSVDGVEHSVYRQCFPHSVGHWLGMDTHDVANVTHDKALQPGVVLTIEPALYFPNEPSYRHFAGLGVRIEDDVAITTDTPYVLSDSVPVDPEQLEQIVGSQVA